MKEIWMNDEVILVFVNLGTCKCAVITDLAWGERAC